jgi:signal transduction histidine kinase
MHVKRLSPMLQYALVALVGVSAALLAMIVVRRIGYLNTVERLDRRTEQLGVAVQKSIDAKLQVLEAFEALYAVDQTVDAGEFGKFANIILIYHPDIQALQWLPYVPASGLEAFEDFGRSIYGPEFSVKESDEDGDLIAVRPRNYYFPILYTEPLFSNELVIGLDAAFESTRRAVVEAAWHSGQPTASSPIRLVQEAGDQIGVLIYQPIYNAAPSPTSTDERISGIVGLVPVVLRIGDFLAASLADFDSSGFVITLTDSSKPDTALYRSASDALPPNSIAFSAVQQLQLANRTWLLHFTTTTAQIEEESVFSGVIAFVSVIVVDFLLIVYLWQRNRAEEALRGYAATLETTNSELDAFNHTIAHDLKHPLAIINGYAHLLTDEDLTPEGQRMLSTIPKVVDNMVEMIDGLLQLAKLRDSSKAGTAVDMNTALEKAMARFDDSRGWITVDGELPPALGHGPWMTEVFANLINNALKYTPEGRTPSVRVRGVRQGKTVRYEVSDNGIGIKPEDQQRIFEMFTRITDEDHHFAYKGLGIGLSIVRRVIQRQGGEVGVTSQPRQGSTFWFTLPAVPDA